MLSPVGNSDHCTIQTTVRVNKHFDIPKSYLRHIWLYDQADFDEFRLKLSDTDWDECFNDLNVDAACNLWTEKFLNAARDCIPNKVVRIRTRDKPFFNADLRRQRRKKNIAHRKARSTNKPEDWDKFRRLRNSYNDSIRQSKLNCEKTKAERLRDTETLSSKKWWRLAKSFLKQEKTSIIPPLKVGNSIISNDGDKAEAFNNFFAKSSEIDDSQLNKPTSQCDLEQKLPSIQLTQKDVSDLIKCLDISKATGPDHVSHVMLKQAGDIIVPSLTRLFNFSLDSGIFPEMWKRANVTPLHKKNDNAVLDNYRPVSLLSCVGKIFEKGVFKYTFNFLRETGAISLKQSGFIPGDSTSFQLAHLYHIFCDAVNNNKIVRLAFCDISKAFDRVWHVGLLAKLLRVGICDKTHAWFSDYLTNRQQRVVINGQTSQWKPIQAGVPQGSVLGPLLFLIYINDITFQVQSSEVRLFADDTVLYIIADNPSDCVDDFNSDLQSICNWADEWLIKFSPQKTKSITMSRPKIDVNQFLQFGNTDIEEVPSHKHLGLTLSKDLSWNEHIDSVCTKASRSADVLNALKYKLDRRTLERLYFAFVRSKLEYASIVWDNCTEEQKHQLEQVQYRCGKIVSGAISRTSSELVKSELGWPSLAERRKQQRLRTFHKIVHGDAPTYLQEAVPKPAPHRANLRNKDDIPNICIKGIL